MVATPLSIVYITGRQDPRFEWFADSLHRELAGGYEGVEIIVVDYWADENGGSDGPDPVARRTYFEARAHCPLIHVPPKPTVWQGRHRVTKTNYFAAANARNTGVCLASDGWIAFADDLAVLMPGWMETIRRAQRENFIALGAYRKFPGLVVERGVVRVPEDPRRKTDLHGWDSRWENGSDDRPVPASGSWMYGCSVAMPLEALLAINGWDERADARGLGSEDYITGMILERHGYAFRYCRSMMTIEEDVATTSPFVREIATAPGRPDASHVLLEHASSPQCLSAPNYFPEGGIREVRRQVRAGKPFPDQRIPEHCWYSGTRLADL